MESQLNQIKADFAVALEYEQQEANKRRLRDIHEHLSLQKEELEQVMIQKLKDQEQDIKTKAEIDLSLRLGAERAHRL